MLIEDLVNEKLISPPGFLANNTMYLTLVGSVAYGVSDVESDQDIYGFCIPPKDILFPHLRGIIPGFGEQGERFDQYQEHHIKRPSNGHEYDLSIYNIAKYFHLCMGNNPNMIDSLFTPQRCVLHCTKVGHMVRDNRKLFLHKGSWHTFKGYSYAQLHKARNKSKGVAGIRKLEEKLDIPHDISYNEVLEEIKKRGINDGKIHREI